MFKRLVSGTLLVLLLTGLFALTFNIRTVKGTWTGTVYIRADGSIDPPDAPIQRDGNVYTLTGNIASSADGIVVERDNIVIDGAGYTLQGTGSGGGIDLYGRKNVTVQNTRIDNFASGIGQSRYSPINMVHGIRVLKNTITNNRCGVSFIYSYNNIIIENNITNNYYGISLSYSFNNTISRNNITENIHPGAELSDGIELFNSNYTFILGNNILANEFSGIELYGGSSNNIISGNSIKANVEGVSLWESTNNTISGNFIVANEDYGISLIDSSNNTIIENEITKNDMTTISSGIELSSSDGNIIKRNNISDNTYGIKIAYFSTYNVVAENDITANVYYGMAFSPDSSYRNIIYHNNFIGNTWGHVNTWEIFVNVWDNGYPSGGNYWSDYTGIDANGDGIGDTPYTIDANNVDRYPFMAPLKIFEAQHWDGVTYNFHVVSNSSILNFELSESLIPEIPSKISLNVSGPGNTNGFLRMIIPNIIVQDLWQGNYMVLLNGEPWPFRNWTDNTNTYIYINYTHSEHEIKIIPEFPSALILPLFMILTVIAIVFAKKKTYKNRNLNPKPHFSHIIRFSLPIFQSDLMLT